MTTLREAATMALEALHVVLKDDYSLPYEKIVAATDALKTALANYDNELAEIVSDGARCGIYNLPTWCDIHQHYKWCEHNGGVMGPTGWEMP